MPVINDPTIDELRDREGKFLGKAPVQGWLRPISVTLHRPTLRDVIERGGKVDPDGPTDLAFVVHTPWAAPKPPTGYVKPRRRVFEEFLTLGAASDEEIHNFASRFGPLMIFCRAEPSVEKTTETIYERSEVWRYYARCMKSLLRIATNFHAHRLPNSSEWDTIGNCPFPVHNARWRIKDSDVLNPLAFKPEESWSAGAYFVAQGEYRDRDMWAGMLNCLLHLGRARPCVIWEGSGSAAWPRMAYGAPRLLSYLGLQLSLTALKQDAFVPCSACGHDYASIRAPKAGQRNFCPECRNDGVPGRQAQRDRRARIRSLLKKRSRKA